MKISGTKPEQKSYYQSIIGSLLFLALGTQPDIVHAVIMMSQFMVNPSEDHINHQEIGLKKLRLDKVLEDTKYP